MFLHTCRPCQAQGSFVSEVREKPGWTYHLNFFLCNKISENEGHFPCPFGIMLSLISDVIFCRADTGNKDELFSVPGVCTHVVYSVLAMALEGVHSLPGLVGRGQHRPRRDLLESTLTSGHSARVETQACL